MMDFAESLKDYAQGKEPKKYKGAYWQDLAAEIALQLPIDATLEEWAVVGTHRAINQQASDLAAFGVVFDTWKMESSIHNPFPAGIDEFKIRFALGYFYKVSQVSGQPICGNCATVLTPYPEADIAKGSGGCYPCPSCSTSPLFLCSPYFSRMLKHEGITPKLFPKGDADE